MRGVAHRQRAVLVLARVLEGAQVGHRQRMLMQQRHRMLVHGNSSNQTVSTHGTRCVQGLGLLGPMEWHSMHDTPSPC